jgi:hypothetical protein
MKDAVETAADNIVAGLEGRASGGDARLLGALLAETKKQTQILREFRALIVGLMILVLVVAVLLAIL